MTPNIGDTLLISFYEGDDNKLISKRGYIVALTSSPRYNYEIIIYYFYKKKGYWAFYKNPHIKECSVVLTEKFDTNFDRYLNSIKN